MKSLFSKLFATVFIFGFVFCLFGFSGLAFAQFNVVPQDDINITMVPENPGPNQTVSISIASYSTNIDAATITWKVNGATKQSGLGSKNFSFVTGNSNTTTTVAVVVRTSGGQTV